MSKAEKERRATWLELFYDLVFSASVAELGISLYTNYTTLASFLGTVSLFFPVCWTWIGVTFYGARFETDDLIHRVHILLQMAGAAALALNIHGALGETYFNFAISYAAIRTFLVIEYIRGGHNSCCPPIYKQICTRFFYFHDIMVNFSIYPYT